MVSDIHCACETFLLMLFNFDLLLCRLWMQPLPTMILNSRNNPQKLVLLLSLMDLSSKPYLKCYTILVCTFNEILTLKIISGSFAFFSFSAARVTLIFFFSLFNSIEYMWHIFQHLPYFCVLLPVIRILCCKRNLR